MAITRDTNIYFSIPRRYYVYRWRRILKCLFEFKKYNECDYSEYSINRYYIFDRFWITIKNTVG